MTMKGVILAAGSGEALKPITDAYPKAMIKLLDKPIIQFAIERLVDNGIKDIIIVISHETESIRTYFLNGDQFNVNISYTYQEDMSGGISAALNTVQKYIKEDEQFILLHSDIIASRGILRRVLNAAENNGTDYALAATLVRETLDFGIVSINPNGLVSKIEDREESDGSHYVIAGVFLLKGDIFEYLDNPFNEALNKLIESGQEIACGIWNDKWIDIGRSWNMLQASQFLLEQLDYATISANAYIEDRVEIRGPVIIERGAEILNGTIIKGPVYIGKDVFIGNNSLIRDMAVIHDHARIGMGAEIRTSIIMDHAYVGRQSYVGHSIVGPYSILYSNIVTMNINLPETPIITRVLNKDIIVPMKKFGAVIGPKSSVNAHTSLYPGTVIESETIVGPNQSVSGYINKNI